MVSLQQPDPPNAPCCTPPDFTEFEFATCAAEGEFAGCARWVGPPYTYHEANEDPSSATFRAAQLLCSPFFHDWSNEPSGVLYIVGAEIVPSSTYEVRFITQDPGGCIQPMTLQTARWGDVAAPYSTPSGYAQPDGLDVTALVNKFRSVGGAPSRTQAQLQANAMLLLTDVSALDIVAVVNAFKGLAYPYGGPCPCPSSVICNATTCTNSSQCGGGACVRQCEGGTNSAAECTANSHCGSGICGPGHCADRCGRCTVP